MMETGILWYYYMKNFYEFKTDRDELWYRWRLMSLSFTAKVHSALFGWIDGWIMDGWMDHGWMDATLGGWGVVVMHCLMTLQPWGYQDQLLSMKV